MVNSPGYHSHKAIHTVVALVYPYWVCLCAYWSVPESSQQSTFLYQCTWLFHLLTSVYWDGWQSIGRFLGLACLWPCIWLKVSILVYIWIHDLAHSSSSSLSLSCSHLFYDHLAVPSSWEWLNWTMGPVSYHPPRHLLTTPTPSTIHQTQESPCLCFTVPFNNQLQVWSNNQSNHQLIA